MRTKIVQVICDNCGDVIENFFKGDTTKNIRELDGIANYSGDFCNKECFKEYKKNNEIPKYQRERK